jgi:hypothetical protein
MDYTVMTTAHLSLMSRLPPVRYAIDGWNLISNVCYWLMSVAAQLHRRGSDLVIVDRTSPPVGVALQAHPEFRHQFRY